MFIAIKTEDGALKGKISFYCKSLGLTRQGFHNYLKYKDKLGNTSLLQMPCWISVLKMNAMIPMEEIGISHRPRRKPNGITKADKEARKSDDLMKRNFKSDKPLEKCVTDMTEVKCLDGKLYVSAVFDCFDSAVLGLAMDTSLKQRNRGKPINRV